MAKGQVGQLPTLEPEYKLPLDEHTPHSKWQFCMCRSCQDYRFLIDSQPGGPVNYQKGQA